LKEQRVNKKLNQEELKELRVMRKRGDSIDEDHFYELELRDRQQQGHPLSEDKTYKLDLLNQLQKGKDLNDNELEDLDLFKEKRLLDRKLQLELKDLGERRKSGEMIDDDLLIKLELIKLELLKCQRLGEELDKRNLVALDLFA
jgi:hypothetical protein